MTESPLVPDITVPHPDRPATVYQLDLLRREVADLRRIVTQLTASRTDSTRRSDP